MKPINTGNVTDRRERFAEISIPMGRGFVVGSVGEKTWGNKFETVGINTRNLKSV